MPAIVISITRYTSDDQPGFVEGEFYDAWGKKHTFEEKVPYVSAAYLSADSEYPVPGEIDCEVLREWTDDNIRAIVRVTTGKPIEIESKEGIAEFDVLKEQLVNVKG